MLAFGDGCAEPALLYSGLPTRLVAVSGQRSIASSRVEEP
jgi:hypothetical protein